MSSTYVPAALRRRVQEYAQGCCEYCLLSEEDAYFSHEADRIISEKHGGETVFENLAWSCFDCNRFKGSDIASLDPASGSLRPLFNLRSQSWSDHFQHVDGVIQPQTSIGVVTGNILRLNLPERIEIRQALTLVGRYPRTRN